MLQLPGRLGVGGVEWGPQLQPNFAWGSRQHQRWLSGNLLVALNSERAVAVIHAPGH